MKGTWLLFFVLTARLPFLERESMADGVHGRKKEGGRVDMPTTKWRAGCACERLSKFSKCFSKKKVFKVQRERESGGSQAHSLDSRERERERDLTKKMIGLVLHVLDHPLCADSYRRPVIAEFIRVSLYRPAIKAWQEIPRRACIDRPWAEFVSGNAGIWWLGRTDSRGTNRITNHGD
jgi:hypothetical protein